MSLVFHYGFRLLKSLFGYNASLVFSMENLAHFTSFRFSKISGFFIFQMKIWFVFFILVHDAVIWFLMHNLAYFCNVWF